MTRSMSDLLAAAPARLAPMAGLTNAPFREIAVACGSGFTTNEEIDAAAFLHGDGRDADRVRSERAAPDAVVAMQLLGADAETLVPAAERLVERGADIIDINMGCPVPKIVRRGKGAALMRDVPRTATILDALRRALPGVPLTIKMRGGWDDDTQNAVEVARMAQDVGVDAITVHPRTRQQRFDGGAPWDAIGQVVRAVSLPVTGNGDVRSLAEARRMMAETGCTDVMIGRGALGRPWVFDPAYERLTAAERDAYRQRVVGRHMRAIARSFSGREALVQMQKHLALYTAGSADARAWRRRWFACRTPAELRAAYRDYAGGAGAPASEASTSGAAVSAGATSGVASR